MRINLQYLSQLYKDGVNIIDYLKEKSDLKLDEIIQISYDLQSGSYIELYKSKETFYEQYTDEITGIIDSLQLESYSIMEIGVGEATTLANVVKKARKKPNRVIGFDISWSRIKYAQEYYRQINDTSCTMFLGDLFEMPLKDNSVDVVYTCHSLEPNGGREKEALLELMRVANKYLVLLEPSYNFADDKGKARMDRLGYVKDLYAIVKENSWEVVEYGKFKIPTNPMNPTELIIIKKNGANTESKFTFMCPKSKEDMYLNHGSYYSERGMYAYPIIDDIPCLTKNNAVVATKYIQR